jgi:hypothetical protein
MAPFAGEVDARCAMDDAFVPRRHDQLTAHQRDLLDMLVHTKLSDEFTTARINKAVREGNIAFEDGWDRPS